MGGRAGSEGKREGQRGGPGSSPDLSIGPEGSVWEPGPQRCLWSDPGIQAAARHQAMRRPS